MACDGEPFGFQGEFYNLCEVTFLPKPVQSPRIPIWIGGGYNTPAAARRGARWMVSSPQKWQQLISVDEWRVIIDRVARHRTAETPIDLVQNGRTPGHDPAKAAEIVGPFAALGLTWWIEHVDHGGLGSTGANT